MSKAPQAKPRPLTLAIQLALLSAAAHAQQPSNEADTTLAEVKIRATASAEPTTEGTHSYTSGSMSTSTGLDLSIRDTPQSVSVVTQERIEDQDLRTITDVVDNVTGISAKPYDSARSGFSARGFDLTNLMIDGSPTTWETGWSAGETQTDTAIYDRVEVVRGATGLTTGAGNPSAAINLVRKHATSRSFTGSASADMGTWNDYGAQVDLSTPLAADGAVRGRFVASYRQQDSYIDLMANRKSVFYGVIDADLGARTQLSAGASRQNNDPSGSTWGGLPPWYADGSRTDWDRSKTTAADWSNWSSTSTTAFANLSHHFDNDWKLRAVYNHGESDAALRLLYLSGSPDRSTGFGMDALPAYYDTTRRQDDASIHANGPFSLFGRKHELGFGLSYSLQKFHSTARDALSVTGVGDFNNWNGALYPEPEWSPGYDYETTETRQTAAYGVARFSLADRVRLILGARLSHWKTSGENWSGPYSFEYDNVFTPYAGLTWDFSDALSAYASYTDIFEPQDYRDRNGAYLDPITGRNYEIGLKGELLDGALNAQLAVFRIVQNNLAQPDTGHLVPGTIDQAYYGAEGASSTGYDIDVSGEITRDWSLSVGWSQFVAEDAFNQPVNTNHPRSMLKVFTKYRLPGALNRLSLGAGVNRESSNYTIATNPAGNPERLEQPAYALVNLMARYDFTKDLSVQLNINNLFDKKYYSQIGFYNQLAYGEPLNGALAMKYRF